MCRWSSRRPCASSSTASRARIDEYEIAADQQPAVRGPHQGHRGDHRRGVHRAGASPDRSCAARASAYDFRKAHALQRLRAVRFRRPDRHATATSTPATWCAWTRCASRCASSEQALDKLPGGPVRSNNRKFVPPPRSELGVEHGSRHPPLQAVDGGLPGARRVRSTSPTESPRGELGVLPGGRRRPEALPRALPHAVLRQPADACRCSRKGHFVADLVGDHRQHRHRPGRCRPW